MDKRFEVLRTDRTRTVVHRDECFHAFVRNSFAKAALTAYDLFNKPQPFSDEDWDAIKKAEREIRSVDGVAGVFGYFDFSQATGRPINSDDLLAEVHAIVDLIWEGRVIPVVDQHDELGVDDE